MFSEDGRDNLLGYIMSLIFISSSNVVTGHGRK